jgi:hypothetical protein
VPTLCAGFDGYVVFWADAALLRLPTSARRGQSADIEVGLNPSGASVCTSGLKVLPTTCGAGLVSDRLTSPFRARWAVADSDERGTFDPSLPSVPALLETSCCLSLWLLRYPCGTRPCCRHKSTSIS